MKPWIQTLVPAGATLALGVVLSATPAPAEESSPPITVSASFALRGTTTSARVPGSVTVPLPECPSGLRFLVRELQASHRTPAPDPGCRNGTCRYSCDTWAVFLATQQNYSTRAYPTPEQLTVVGRGWAHASTSLTAGVDLSDGQVQAGQLTIYAECDARVSGTSTTGFKPGFHVHVGGYCGKPSWLGIVYTVP
jgi:hypothetical protein